MKYIFSTFSLIGFLDQTTNPFQNQDGLALGEYR